MVSLLQTGDRFVVVRFIARSKRAINCPTSLSTLSLRVGLLKMSGFADALPDLLIINSILMHYYYERIDLFVET